MSHLSCPTLYHPHHHPFNLLLERLLSFSACYPDDVKEEPDFDGSNTDKRNWILSQREKMAGWKTEYDKTLDNSAAAGVNDGLPRPVRLRCYNMKDVIVEQVANTLGNLYE